MARKPKVQKEKQVEVIEEAERVEEIVALAPAGTFIVYAEFDEYKAGDVFEIPDGWSVDGDYTELLLTKAKNREGVTFLRPDGGRATLPVKEA